MTTASNGSSFLGMRALLALSVGLATKLAFADSPREIKLSHDRVALVDGHLHVRLAEGLARYIEEENANGKRLWGMPGGSTPRPASPNRAWNNSRNRPLKLSFAV